MKNKYLILGLAWVVLLLVGCAANRKLQAASILKQCHMQIAAVQVERFELSPDLFPESNDANNPFPNAQVLPLVQKMLEGQLEQPLGFVHLRIEMQIDNQSEDSLWVDSLEAQVQLDSLLQSPLRLLHPVVLGPGSHRAMVATSVPLDPKLFTLSSAKNYRIFGVMVAALQPEGSRMSLDFDEKKPIPQEALDSFLKNAQKDLIQQLLTQWVGTLL